MCRTLGERLVATARDALTATEATVAWQVLAADLALLTDLTAQIATAEAGVWIERFANTKFGVECGAPGT